MLRLVFVLGLVAGVGLFLTPTQPGSAHFYGCGQIARDSTVSILTFNYAWFAVNGCTAETDALTVNAHVQFYEWNSEQWVDDPAVSSIHEDEIDDDAVIAFGALYVAPYLGVNCRRVRAFFVTVDQHGNEFDTGTVFSNGECY